MEKKRIRSLAPCPIYDVEKVECWLSDMAKEGWMLEKDSEIFGWLAFTKEAPRSVEYRLETKEPGKGFGDTPDQDFRELCEEYGWEYVDSYGNFFIYRSIRSDFREMNTDLEVQAAAIKAGRRNSAVTVFSSVFLLNYAFRSLLKMPCFWLIHMGLGHLLVCLLVLIWVCADSFLQWHHLRKLQKQLKGNIPLNHRKPWRKEAAFHIFSKFAYILVIFLFFGSLFGACSRAVEQETDAPKTADYPGDPPFVTAADILPEGEYTSRSTFLDYNTYIETDTFFAPTIVEWNEDGQILLPDGSRYDGILRIRYYETRTPWLAEGLFRDLYREAKGEHHFVELIPPALEVDDIICYNSIYPTILIRQGNVVVEATMGLEYKDRYLTEEWAQRMAEMLIRE